MPETRADARLLAFLLNAGCFPTYKRETKKRERFKPEPDAIHGRKPVSTCGDEQGTRAPALRLGETELKARGA